MTLVVLGQREKVKGLKGLNFPPFPLVAAFLPPTASFKVPGAKLMMEVIAVAKAIRTKLNTGTLTSQSFPLEPSALCLLLYHFFYDFYATIPMS